MLLGNDYNIHNAIKPYNIIRLIPTRILFNTKFVVLTRSIIPFLNTKNDKLLAIITAITNIIYADIIHLSRPEILYA